MDNFSGIALVQCISFYVAYYYNYREQSSTVKWIWLWQISLLQGLYLMNVSGTYNVNYIFGENFSTILRFLVTNLGGIL